MVKKISFKSNSTIYDLLKRYKLINKKIAIEYNGSIVPKINYKKILKRDDKIEIVHFIGGG